MAGNNNRDRIIISLTSISARDEALRQTVASLVSQDFPGCFEVRIYLSHEPYLIDHGVAEVPPWVADLSEDNAKCELKVHFVRNTGPYRKLLPVLEECLRDSVMTTIVTCDDDTLYPSNWLSTLLTHHRRIGALVAFRGHTMRLSANGEGLLPYARWQANPQKSHLCLANLPTGKDGIVYRPSYFGPEVLDVDRAIEIAPTADDLWLRWHSIIRGVPCYLADLRENVFRPAAHYDDDISLWKAYNRVGGNDTTIAKLERYFRSRFGTTVADTLRQYDTEKAALSTGAERRRERKTVYYAARQVRILETMQSAGVSRQELVARSYELFRLANRSAMRRPTPEPRTEPREDRGGMRYAIDEVGRFDKAYGWLSRADEQASSTLVTVVMTTFNAEATVNWAVQSVLNQDHSNVELIVVDDVSTDRTREILRELKAADARVRLVFLKKNRGTYFAKNVGLTKATGEVIAFQDSDDWSHPARLRLQLWRLRSTGKLATRCNYVRHHAHLDQLVKVSGRIESPGFITLVTRRDVFRSYGYFDCSRRAADDEFICRLKTLHGEGAVDTFSLPAYVALYSDNSLIADSSRYSAQNGIEFTLSKGRQAYKDAYVAWHLSLAANPALVEKYRFPPRSIFIEKSPELRAFDVAELAALRDEVKVGEV